MEARIEKMFHRHPLPRLFSIRRHCCRRHRGSGSGSSSGSGSGSGSDSGGGGGDVGRGCGRGSCGMRAVAEAAHAERLLPRAEQSSVEVWEERRKTAFSNVDRFEHRDRVSDQVGFFLEFSTKMMAKSSQNAPPSQAPA